MEFTVVLTNILLTMGAYIAFPVIRLLINGKKFDKKQAQKIALWNSIVWGIIFCIATTASGATWNAGAAVIYYFLNKAILTENESDENNTANESCSNPVQQPTTVTVKEEAPEEVISEEDENVKEFYRLESLFYEKQEQFRKAKAKRIMQSGIVLATTYFLLFVLINVICNEGMYTILTVDPIPNFVLLAFLSVIAAGIHLLITLACGYSSQRSVCEKGMLDDIINKMRELEKTINID